MARNVYMSRRCPLIDAADQVLAVDRFSLQNLHLRNYYQQTMGRTVHERTQRLREQVTQWVASEPNMRQCSPVVLARGIFIHVECLSHNHKIASSYNHTYIT